MDNNRKDTEVLVSSLKEYVDNMIRIRSLSSPDLLGITNAEAYSYVLLENFRNIGMLAEKDRALISEFIDPILDSREPLDSETISAIVKLNEELLDASEVENIDLPLASLLTDRLLVDADAKDDIDYRIGMLDKVIENSYLLINMTKRVVSDSEIVDTYRKRGIEALDKLLEYLDKDLFCTFSHESREIIVTNARYGAALYECLDLNNGDNTARQFALLENALKIANDPFYIEAMPDFDWKYYLFRTYEYLTRLDYMYSDDDTINKAVVYADRCLQIWESEPEYYKDLSEYEEIEGRRLRIQYLAGIISNLEYREKLYTMYEDRNIQDYSAVGYDMNIEFPTDYLRFMDEDDINEMDISRSEEIYRSALAYIFHMPKLGLLTVTLDPYSKLLLSFREYTGNIDFEEMGIQSFAALHPPTYIHSKMVADITRCLTRNLMQMKPELFYDAFRYLDMEDTPENRDKIIDFAYHAALCHDFGKLMIIDTIFVYGRKLLDMEFDLVKQHPDIGYALLSANSSTHKYAEVARGHHLWYDGSRGYPASFDASESPLKIIIDIVAIADCMDAATDSVGRSYNRGKTFADYEQEVKKDAGTRYAPWGPELLKDEKTRRDLEYLLNEGRMGLYKDTYKLLTSLEMREDQRDKGMQTTLGEARKALSDMQRRIGSYNYAAELIYYDGNTTAPSDTAANRAQSLSVIMEELYRLKTCEDTVRLLEYLDDHKGELDQDERRMVHLLIKDIRDMQKIPVDEYVAYQELLTMSGDVWARAKEASDFEMLRPYLEKVFAAVKKFALYIEPDKDPYDHCLNDYEEGLTTAICDEFFDRLRSGIVPLIKEISEKQQVDDSICHGVFPEKEQQQLAYYLMDFLGLDQGHVGLGTTEHPFTTMIGSHFDERITTHYHDDDFSKSMYSVIHEGGHALYDTGSADGLEYTVLDGGVSMSIHESQSRFYENIIGRSSAFCHYIFPKLKELFPEQMKGYDADDLYRAVNRVQPSLIRTQADELTYSLHVMIRYELEKKIFSGEIEVKDLPSEWNRLYKEYLGVDVPNDREGVLQDSHWADGAIGYFPSYALGNAYGAQFLSKMKESVDMDACISAGDLGPVNDWNREHIWKHGSLYRPSELLDRVLGESFDPDYYINYLREKMHDIYACNSK